MAVLPHRSLITRLAEVRLVLCTVDGVLTDGRLCLGHGHEHQTFHTADALGTALLQRNGVRVGWISHRPSEAAAHYAKTLGIDFLHQDSTSTVQSVETILTEAALAWDNVCLIAADVLELGAMRRAGFAVAVADAAEEIRAAAHYVTQAAGGAGAVREVAQLVLEAHQRWSDIIEELES